MDGISGLIIGTVLGDGTEYAIDYSDHNFGLIRPGMTQAEVESLVGTPIGETWAYAQHQADCPDVYLERGSVVYGCNAFDITKGTRAAEVFSRLNAPNDITWLYSRRGRRKDYRERVVTFRGCLVTARHSEWYF